MTPAMPALQSDARSRPRIGVVGGGVAGATIAMRLAQNPDCEVVLLEKGPSLVNGPPICHLHAGGNLYRELPQDQCLTLLEQSIQTLRFFPHCANVRPTVIAVPIRDPGEVSSLLPRLETVQAHYHKLVATDPANAVLGAPDNYFRLYDRATLTELATRPLPETPQCDDDWMIPLAKELDFDQVKWPLILVQEYGLSVFRLAANAAMVLAQQANCQVRLDTEVVDLQRQNGGWWLSLKHFGQSSALQVDYLVNACGYRSGALDDMASLPRQRLVEFKAAYVTQWGERQGEWPELIFHGQRGSPQGMAQFTPYADGLVQLHGMTENITLFKQGLVASPVDSAQPRLASQFQRKLNTGWPDTLVQERSKRAIEHMARFLPRFASANPAAKPLFGAQQIPGQDPALRAAEVSFAGEHYARAEIVKANSALPVAEAILAQLQQLGWLPRRSPEPLPLCDDAEVEQQAMQMAKARAYPAALAQRTGLAPI
ncbi:FAD-dependent oxidoreductase [Ferrimonas marina]|uniref:FAD dependent oxidoreductase n=1 Tax=Ferrimonas marina TaxID=299255 RepID=A0A1M5NXN5_9GAMM|nr:FAD-dependent oxidoreductase [Ferrimonas marina]SHG94272.1 FAD dependent oxidoreductase [Ferrimonas marina]